MELEKQQVTLLRDKGSKILQLTMDEDYNLPDYKPDIYKIIESAGTIHLEDVHPENGSIRFSGHLKFKVLYQTKKGQWDFALIEGEVPFADSLYMEEADENSQVKTRMQLEDLSIGWINSRKLQVRALARFEATVKEVVNLSFTTDLVAPKVAVKKQTCHLLELVEQKKDTCRVRGEIELNSGKMDMQEILWNYGELRGVDYRLTSEGVNFTGELQVNLLYRAPEADSPLQYLEVTLPVKEELALRNNVEDGLLEFHAGCNHLELDIREDIDGDLRILGIDALLDVEICVSKERELDLLEDAYEIEKELKVTFQKNKGKRLLVKNDAKMRINSTLDIEKNKLEALADEKQPILQLTCQSACVQVEEAKLKDQGVYVCGVVECKLLYITGSDDNPLASVHKIVPFEYLVDVPKWKQLLEQGECDKAACLLQLDAGIDNISYSLMDENRIEVKGVLDLHILLLEQQLMKQIVEVEEAEWETDCMCKLPGMTGYVVKHKETLWDVAKKYHLLVSDLMAMNNLSEETVNAGDRLMIANQIL